MENNINWFLTIIEKFKTGNITVMDIFSFLLFYLVIDLIYKSQKKRPHESLLGIMVLSIFNIIKLRMENNKTNNDNNSKNNTNEEKIIEQNNVIKELMKKHYVFNKINDFDKYLIAEIKNNLRFWTDRKIPLNYSGIPSNCYEDILNERQKIFQDQFKIVTNKHLLDIIDKIQEYRKKIKIDNSSQKIMYKKYILNDISRIIDSSIENYSIDISKIILTDKELKKNIIFYTEIRNVMENILRLLKTLKQQTIDQQFPEDNRPSFIEFEWVVRKYFDYFYVQLEFLIVMISNDIKNNIFQEISLDKELEKLISILKNESIEIVNSIDEMLQLENISQFQIVIIDNSSGNNLNKSYINFTGRNTKINDWIELKTFLQSIDLDDLYEKYNKN